MLPGTIGLAVGRSRLTQRRLVDESIYDRLSGRPCGTDDRLRRGRERAANSTQIDRNRVVGDRYRRGLVRRTENPTRHESIWWELSTSPIG
jgi:hypothetical protein